MQKRTVPITAPHQGILVSIEVNVADAVQRGQRLAVMEAMKMEFIVEASCDGVVREIAASVEEAVSAGQPLLFIEPVEATSERVEQGQPLDLEPSAPTCQRSR